MTNTAAASRHDEARVRAHRRPLPVRRHPLWTEEGTWTRSEIEAARRSCPQLVARHVPALPSALAR
jgi:hypothetical protein